MAEEPRQVRSIKIRPSILRKAHHQAIESSKTLGEWMEDAIEDKIARGGRENSSRQRGAVFALGSRITNLRVKVCSVFVKLIR